MRTLFSILVFTFVSVGACAQSTILIKNVNIWNGTSDHLLIYEGNPLEDIQVVAHPEKNLKLIMKDRRIYKSEL